MVVLTVELKAASKGHMMVEELDDVLAVWKAYLMDDDLVSKLVVLRENNWVDVVAVEWEELTADGLDFVSVGLKELTLSDKKVSQKAFGLAEVLVFSVAVLSGA